MSEKYPITIHEGETSDLLAKLTTKAYISLFIVLFFSLFKIFRGGIVGNDYIVLLIGSILSITSLLSFGLQIIIDAGNKKRGLIPMLIGISSFIPYLFGCYLFFYRGLWYLTRLRTGFSIIVVLKSFVFILIGYSVVNGIYRLSELSRQVDEGAILLPGGSHEKG